MKYDKQYYISTGELGFYDLNRQDHRRILELVNFTEKRVLDIGCGYGSLLRRISTLNSYKFGLESNKHAVSICRKFGLNVNLHTNTEKLPYKNYSFDIVILNEVLEHLKNPTKTLNEVKRILKNRGTLVITTPNCGFLVRNLHPTHISEMTYKDLEKLIRPLGFEVINHEVRGFGLYDFLGRYAIFPLGKRLAGEKLLRKSIYAIRKKADSGRFSRFRKGFVWFGSQQLLIARSE